MKLVQSESLKEEWKEKEDNERLIGLDDFVTLLQKSNAST